MEKVAWLAAPYLSMLVICRSPMLARCVAGRTGFTLPLGWLAIAALLAGVVRAWPVPVVVMAVCAAVSGLAMITAPADGGDDGPGPDDGGDAPPPPVVDWDAFDAARAQWARNRRRRPRGTPSPSR